MSLDERPAQAADAAKPLVLVDGSGYIFRAFHALPMMTRPDGTPVNAVFGFTKMLMKLVDDLKPEAIAVIFDAGRTTFRNEIYPEYKANRGEPPEELVPQFDLVRDATRALSLPLLEIPGFEADDLIATYARLASAAGRPSLIVSSDKDLMQLVTDDVSMLDPMKNRRISFAEVDEKFGVRPDQVVDVQALAGDSTDNVPGVPGIGIKTAAQLITEFGDLEALLAGAETIKQPKRRESLITFAEQARISRQLVELKNDVDVPLDLEALQTPVRDDATLNQFLADMGFRSLLAARNVAPQSVSSSAPSSASNSTEIGDKSASDEAISDIHPPHVEQADYQLITDEADLAQWVADARRQGFVAVDTETSNLNAASAELIGISLALAPGKACYIPLAHQLEAAEGQSGFDFGGADDAALTEAGTQGTAAQQLSLNLVLSYLAPLFEDASVLKIGHNLKYDCHVLRHCLHPETGRPLDVNPVDDTMCLSYVLDAGRVERHGLDHLAMHWLQHQTIKYEDICGKGVKQIPFSAVPLDKACDYAAEDADITLRLWMMLKPRLAREGMSSVYERLERPLIRILAQMESEGIAVDMGILRHLSDDFATRIHQFEAEIHTLADEEFNIASPKQLGEILFDKMGLEGGKKSKTGAYSTSADILEDLAANGIEIAQKVLEYRQLAKLKSTYTDALMTSRLARTGRVHTSFSMVGASTGRLSSSDPNLQNIPIRTSEGRAIRTAFVAEEGHQLISADYSQIELRLVAHVAREDTMLSAFRNGVDIHAQTAAEVFGIPLDQMDSETRRRAKAINFGIIYGISGFGLARQLGIAQGEARDYIAAYFERFPGIRDYMEQAKDFGRDHGYVETLFGRRVHLSGLDSKNPAMRGFAERQAINAPIQGSAADIIKRAMVRLPAILRDAGLSARMLLQVHDELIFEVAEAEAQQTVQLITKTMEEAPLPVLQLDVPLVAEAGVAKSWAEAH